MIGTDNIKGKYKLSAVNTNKQKTNSITLYDPDWTIIASNITQNTNKYIFLIAKDLVRHLSDSAKVLAAVRLWSWVNDTPGLVKIIFQSVEEKVSLSYKARINGYPGLQICFP